MDLNKYDHIIIAFSGGKDSISCVLDVLGAGVDMRKVELWHHEIDGGDTDGMFMDWPCTPAYCEAFAKAMHLPIYFSWRCGGFQREMLRENSQTAPIEFQDEEFNLVRVTSNRSKFSTRNKFPQVTANLQQRWCSSYLKIDVMRIAINNQPRFRGAKTLVITGERAEESAARAAYEVFEDHKCHRMGPRVQRYVMHWRPIHAWDEERVWDTLRSYGIYPHPAYRLGWGRLSCMGCIFGSDAMWASFAQIDPGRFDEISGYEEQFKCSIHRTKYLHERIQEAKPFVDMDPEVIGEALRTDYKTPIITNTWRLPAGAFGENAGPT